MLLIKNGRIKTMAGKEFERGCILIDDNGKITSVGENIEAPPECEIIDAEGRLVTPGGVEGHCHIGVRNTAIGWEGIDHNEKTDSVTPYMRAIDAINPLDESFKDAIEHGVTSACTGPGSANVVGGTFAAIKLYGKCVDKMIIKNPVAMKCAFGENPKSAYGQNKQTPITRMAIAALLRELLFKSRAYLEDREAGEAKFDMKLEAMIPVMNGEIPLKVHAHRADDILTAIRIAREFNVRITIDHCTEGGIIAEEIAETSFPVFVGPSFGGKSKPELALKGFETVAKLYDAGVPVSIITDSPVVPIQHLTMCAGFAVASGLPYDEAWKAITINPAVHMGISDRVGSLEVGKDGDVVIWTSDPLLNIGAKAHITVIEGKVVYQS